MYIGKKPPLSLPDQRVRRGVLQLEAGAGGVVAGPVAVRPAGVRHPVVRLDRVDLQS